MRLICLLLVLYNYNIDYYCLFLIFILLLTRYPDKGASILADFASNRKRYCTPAQVVVRLTHFVADALHLLPAAAPRMGTVVDLSLTVPVQTIAKFPSWILLNDELCFQVCM